MTEERDILKEVNEMSESITELDIVREAVDRECPPTQDEFFEICAWLINEVEKLKVLCDNHEKNRWENFHLAVRRREQIDSLTKKRDELKQFKEYAIAQMDADGEAFDKVDKEIKKLKAKLAKAEERVKELEGPDYCLRCAGTGSLKFTSCFKCNGTGRVK